MEPIDVENTLVKYSTRVIEPTCLLQVAEILCPNKARLSISGWFHGPDVGREAPPMEAQPPLSVPAPTCVRSTVFSVVNVYHRLDT